MNVFEFMSDSPILSFFLAYFVLKLVSAGFRSITVWMHGYPPVWCDSYGRFPDKSTTTESKDNAEA